ncbi:lysophospholipid acyltransferase LPCAT4 [Scomber japonicus]|uniref:lysophospholipid acyltransferase LPCAT4 n=1 Tax=Scomber japonicus TaxID=13676 RepID=UPI0023055B5E|nr:lysophospholipid acyltransferase LPCAT4 [Scomber japonicus]
MERDDCHPATPEYPHPFVHVVTLTTAQRIRGIILGSILFPLRIALASLCFLLSWPFARLRLAGLSEEERSRPVTGWRSWLLHPIVWFWSRSVFFCLGFLWVKVKGRRADLKEAPVLVVAPHSGFLDMLVLFPTQLPTVVSRSENTSLPVVGVQPQSDLLPTEQLYWRQPQGLMVFTQRQALGLPATDYVMEGRVPVSKLGGLSLPLESPARETLSLLHRNGLGASEVEAALGRMIDRCQSGPRGLKASAEELASILGLTDKQTASICSLYSKDDTVDLRQIYLGVAALSGFVSFKSLLHTAFTLFDREGSGSLSAEQLSGLMGALLGVPQLNTTELYSEASRDGRLTEDDLLRVLTTHPTYQRVVNQHLQPDEDLDGPLLSNGKVVNNNGLMLDSNGSLHHHKKLE